MGFIHFYGGSYQITSHEEVSTGVHAFTHNIGHLNYTINITLKESGIYAYLSSKSETQFIIHVRTFSGTYVSTSAIDVSIVGNNNQ